MTKYIQSKLYKIVSDHTDVIYVGITINKYLKCHLSGLRTKYKTWLANPNNTYYPYYHLLQYPDVKIFMIKDAPCCDINNQTRLLTNKIKQLQEQGSRLIHRETKVIGCQPHPDLSSKIVSNQLPAVLP